VIVHYWLKEAPRGDLTLTFLDAGGRELRAFTSRRSAMTAHDDAAGSTPEAASSEEVGVTPAPAEADGDEEPRPTKDAGANRFVWNLRGPAATKLPDNKGRGGTIEMLTAPRVPPGTYQVRLTVNGRTLTQAFEIVKDPRVQVPDADLREQFAWAKKAYDLLNRVHDAVLRLRDVRSQAEGWARRVQTAAVKDAATALAQTLTTIENELVQVRSDDPRMFPAKLNSRIATIVGLLDSADAPPSTPLRDLYDNLALRATMELSKLDHCLTTDVPAFNTLCRETEVAAIIANPSAGG
jgi:hypothetical protein